VFGHLIEAVRLETKDPKGPKLPIDKSPPRGKPPRGHVWSRVLQKYRHLGWDSKGRARRSIKDLDR